MKLRVDVSSILLILAVGVVSGQRQGNAACLTGTVYDQVGNSVADAKVIATNEERKQFETITREDGSYVLLLPVNAFKPGGDFHRRISTYSVKVSLTGFRPTEIKGLKLVPTKSGKYRLDAVLEVGILGDN